LADRRGPPRAAERSARVGADETPSQVRWIRTYALAEEDGQVGTVCIYQATGPDAIREHASRAFLPVDEIVTVADTVIVNEDPHPAASTS
jgi:hypothetical protein